jgi:hypothetical protein
MHGLLFAVLLSASLPQLAAVEPPPVAQQRGALANPFPPPDPNAPPVIDIAMRIVRASAGGSSIARSAARADEQAYLYAGLGPCVMGAGGEDPARENSITWRASGRVRSVERGIAVADVEWQRVEYRPSGIVAGPRVRTTLTLPLGERVAVDFVEVPVSACRLDALIFEVGVAPDHGRRLAMSAEGRSESGGISGGVRGGGGAGGIGRRLTPAEIELQAERSRQGAEAARTAVIVTRPMPPREYSIDVWLVPAAPSRSPAPALAQRLSQNVGGTGGRFAFPPISAQSAGNRAVVTDISALVIPVSGEQLVVAITRHVTPGDGATPVSVGWIKSVPLPRTSDVLSFEIPAPDSSEAAIVPRQGYGLRVSIGRR